jgi:hypothetical protein
MVYSTPRVAAPHVCEFAGSRALAVNFIEFFPVGPSSIARCECGKCARLTRHLVWDDFADWRPLSGIRLRRALRKLEGLGDDEAT